MSSVWPSILRTVVPYVWSLVLSVPVTQEFLDLFNVSDQQAQQVIAGVLTVVVGTVWYSALRWLEERRGRAQNLGEKVRARLPWIVLMGWPTAPTYRPVPVRSPR